MPDLRQLLARCTSRIAQAERLDAESRADAAREARLLVSGVLRITPGELAQRLSAVPSSLPSALPSALMSHEDIERIELALHRRLRGEPLAYAVGWAPFRHLELMVDERVLIPRPETEEVVGHALAVTADQSGGLAVDIGTGSGAIALSLATEGRFSEVVATDVSEDALAVAAANAQRVLGPSHASVMFRHGSDLAPLDGLRPRVIVSNPPYIAYDEAAALPAAVRDWEPPLALFASDGGMARYRALIDGAHDVLFPGGWLVLELDASRAGITAELAVARGYQQVQVKQDLAGRDRVLLAQVPA
ncbi:MAG: peptide chain release factor N(5)-glutamine methyltransferase [Gemmatimonadaceae bacterium]|nr:peptide chain release factor N(5)-glutamine methyltransferase [Gemmatimonadaceae bacterium]